MRPRSTPNHRRFPSGSRPMQFEQLEKRLPLAADPFLLKDIRTGTVRADSRPENFFEFNHQVVFAANMPQTGNELWKSDGTATGTRLVKDINPFQDQPSNPNYFTNVNGTLFFTANDGASGTELWKSDGTEAGTVRVKDLALRRGLSSFPRDLVSVNGLLYFTAVSTLGGLRTLWRSDGTEAGTVEVEQASGVAAYGVSNLTNFNSALFVRKDSAGVGSLWRTNSNGTAIEPFGTSAPTYQPMIVWKNELYFSASQAGFGNELWKSDGTVAGTSMLIDIAPGTYGSSPNNFAVVGPRLFFAATRRGEYAQLWKTDGTAAGTQLVRAVSQSFYPGANPRELTNVSGRLYYVGSSTSGRDLWTSDGTAAGTRIVKDFDLNYTQPVQLNNVNGQLFFTITDFNRGRELWASDGTSAGTILFKEFLPGPDNGLEALAAVNGALFMSANDGRGYELWKSDGTVSGTILVRDIARDTLSGMTGIGHKTLNINGTLYFFSLNFAENRDELWKTDGTSVGTQLVKALPPGLTLTRYLHASMVNLNGTLYFAADSEVAGYQLWKSDGTEVGTQPVMRLAHPPESIVNVSGKLFFANSSNTTGTELWRSDGTAGGTVMVKDILDGARGSFPKNFININGTLFFTAQDSLGIELWKSNGTAAGTVRVRDIAPGALSMLGAFENPEFENVGGVLFFRAADPAGGLELWKSSGTAATTVRVRDLNPGSADSELTSLTNVNGTLFFSATDSPHDIELWKTDGTATGTVRVRDIIVGDIGSTPLRLTNVGGVLYFTAVEYAGGRELWRSDGTSAGTTRILDILPGKDSSAPNFLTSVQGKLYFTATTTTHGTELWTSGGTAGTTKMVADLMQPGSSNPFWLTTLGSILIFTAETTQFGNELWGLETRYQPDVTIIDDNSASFTRSGTWSRVTEGRNGQAYAAAPGTGSSLATWSFDGLTAGTYRIFATWAADGDRSTNVRYRVRESLSVADNLLVKSVNQRRAPAGLTDQGSIWSELGTVIITGQSLVVQLNNNTTTGRAIADAIRIERL